MVMHVCKPSSGEGETVDCWGLTGPGSLLVSSRPLKRICLKIKPNQPLPPDQSTKATKQKQNNNNNNQGGWHMKLTSGLHMHMDPHVCPHLHIHEHVQSSHITKCSLRGKGCTQVENPHYTSLGTSQDGDIHL